MSFFFYEMEEATTIHSNRLVKNIILKFISTKYNKAKAIQIPVKMAQKMTYLQVSWASWHIKHLNHQKRA